MMRGAEIADQSGLGSVGVAVEHMHIEIALPAHQCGQQADRTRAGDEQSAGRPRLRTAAHPFDMVPGLGDDAGGLHQHAGEAEIAIDRDCEIGFDPKPFGAEAVPLLDAALGKAAVAAHVPFAGRTGRTRQRIGTPHDTDNRIADGEPAALRRLLHDAQRTRDRAPAALHRPALRRTGRPGFRDRCRISRARACAPESAPSESGGSAMSSSRTDPLTPGSTVTARMRHRFWCCAGTVGLGDDAADDLPHASVLAIIAIRVGRLV